MADRILVTGASGFVGGHIARALGLAGYHVIGTRCSSSISDDVGSSISEVVQLDCADERAVHRLIHEKRPSTVVHAAAMANSKNCEKDWAAAYRANVIGTSCVCSAAEQLNAKGIYLSSDLVFDGIEAPPVGFCEVDEPIPASRYGQSKLEGELVARKHGATVLRMSLVYGPPIGERGGFLSWMHGAFSSGKPVALFSDEFRTPVYVTDVAEIVKRIVGMQRTQSSLYHVSGGLRLSRVQFGEMYAKVFGFPSSLIERVCQAERPTGVPRPKDVTLSIARIEQELGYRPHRIEEALESMKQLALFHRA